MAPSMKLESGDLSPEVFRASLQNFAQTSGLSWNPDQTFSGATYNYDNGSDLWGDVGYGPNGQNWNTQGSDQTNVFVPGYYSSQKPVLGHPPVMSVDFFRKTYLRGMDNIVAQYGDLSDQFNYFLDTAVAALESRLGLFLYPRVLVTDALQRGFRPGVDFDIELKELDFRAQDWFNWGYLNLQYGPIMAFNQLQLVYPTGLQVLKFPNSWLKIKPMSRTLQIIPPQGALSQVVIGPGGFLVTLLGGQMMDVPAIIFADFCAGFWPFPQQIIHAIGMQVAIYFLEIFSDIVSQGMREYRADVPGGASVTKRFSEGDGSMGATMAFTPRIRQYEKQIDKILFDFQNAYFSATDMFSV